MAETFGFGTDSCYPSVRPTLEVVLAMYQSAARNCEVELPIDDDPAIWNA